MYRDPYKFIVKSQNTQSVNVSDKLIDFIENIEEKKVSRSHVVKELEKYNLETLRTVLQKKYGIGASLRTKKDEIISRLSHKIFNEEGSMTKKTNYKPLSTEKIQITRNQRKETFDQENIPPSNQEYSQVNINSSIKEKKIFFSPIVTHITPRVTFNDQESSPMMISTPIERSSPSYSDYEDDIPCSQVPVSTPMSHHSTQKSWKLLITPKSPMELQLDMEELDKSLCDFRIDGDDDPSFRNGQSDSQISDIIASPIPPSGHPKSSVHLDLNLSTSISQTGRSWLSQSRKSGQIIAPNTPEPSSSNFISRLEKLQAPKNTQERKEEEKLLEDLHLVLPKSQKPSSSKVNVSRKENENETKFKEEIKIDGKDTIIFNITSDFNLGNATLSNIQSIQFNYYN